MNAPDASHDADLDGAPTSEELRAIYDGMVDGLLIAEIESRRFLRANAAICRMLGYSEEELLRLSVDAIHPAAELPGIIERFRAMGRDEVGSVSDIRCLRKDGSVFYADITKRKLLFRGRECMAGFFRDVSDRKAAEESLQKEQELLRHMLELLERDRELIAFEIHEGFAQELTGAQLLLESFEQLYPVAPEEARQAFAEGMRLVRDSIRQSRRLVSGLRPPVLGEFGVLAAIEHLIQENGEAGGPQVEYRAPDELPRLVGPVENALFRIVEESLTNARRHSRSDHVRLDVSLEDSWVRVAVCDFGVGFDPGAVDPDHFGLRGIRERARLLAGRAEIESAPGRGTRVSVELPLVPRMAQETEAEW